MTKQQERQAEERRRARDEQLEAALRQRVQAILESWHRRKMRQPARPKR